MQVGSDDVFRENIGPSASGLKASGKLQHTFNKSSDGEACCFATMPNACLDRMSLRRLLDCMHMSIEELANMQ